MSLKDDSDFIASTIPYYPFKGIDRFYDISGMCANPVSFKYRNSAIDYIIGVDARGFVIGAPVAVALSIPFVMVRKSGKLPNATTGGEYFKEYKGDGSHGEDAMCIPNNIITPGARVLIIDDLMATGGTLIASCDLARSVGAEIIGCAIIVELKALNGTAKLLEKYPSVEVWSLLDESQLTLEGRQLQATTATTA